MRPFAALVVSFAALGLAACGSVESLHPLGDVATEGFDESLVGYWREDTERPPADDEAPPVVVVGKAGGGEGSPPEALDACWVGLADDERLEVVRLRLQATRLSGRRYLSARGEGKDDRWNFVRYEAEGKDRLWIHYPDVAFFARAVQEGRLAGTVEGEDEDLAKRTVRLTASTAELRAFVAAHADAAFHRAERPLRRLKPSAPTEEPKPAPK